MLVPIKPKALGADDVGVRQEPLGSVHHRIELRDHAFSDREICWRRGDVEVAEGYFGGGTKLRCSSMLSSSGGATLRGRRRSSLVSTKYRMLSLGGMTRNGVRTNSVASDIRSFLVRADLSGTCFCGHVHRVVFETTAVSRTRFSRPRHHQLMQEIRRHK